MIIRVQLPFRVLNINLMEEFVLTNLKELCVLGMGICMLTIYQMLKPIKVSKWRKYKPEDKFNL